MIVEWTAPLCEWLGVSFVGLCLIAIIILLVIKCLRG